MSAVTEKIILKEIRVLREVLERIEALLEERLIGVEEPLPTRLGLSRSMKLRRRGIG